MINIPKKPPPSYLVTIGIPFAMLFTVFSFQRVGFNLQDFRENLANRAIVTDPLLTLNGVGLGKILLMLW